MRNSSPSFLRFITVVAWMTCLCGGLGAQDTITVCSRTDLSLSVDPIPGATAYEWRRQNHDFPEQVLRQSTTNTIVVRPGYSGGKPMSTIKYSQWRYRVRPIFPDRRGPFQLIATVDVHPAPIFLDMELYNVCSLNPERGTATATLNYANVGFFGATYYRVYSLDGNFDRTQINDKVFAELPPGRFQSEAWFEGDSCRYDGEEFVVEDVAEEYLRVDYTTEYDCSSDRWTVGFGGPDSIGQENLRLSLDGQNFAPVSSFSDLPAGDYTLYARDLDGCQSGRVALGLQRVPAAVSAVTPARCGSADGEVLLAGPPLTDRVQSFGYELLRNGEVVRRGEPGQRRFSDLPAGNYAAREYVAGCGDAPVAFRIAAEGELPSATLQIDRGECGQPTQVTVIPGSDEQLEYVLDGGSPTRSPAFTVSEVGVHELVARRIGDLCERVFAFTVYEFSGLQVATQDYYGDCLAGSVRLSAPSGGKPPYTFRLAGGPPVTDSLFNGLSPGDYTVEVTDSLGCSLSRSFTIQDYTYEPEVTGFSLQNCTPIGFARTRGAATVSLPRGDLEVTIELIEDWAGGGSAGFSLNGWFYDLDAGPYLARVRLGPDCVKEVGFEIYQDCGNLPLLLEADPIRCAGDTSYLTARLPGSPSSPPEYSFQEGPWTTTPGWRLPGAGHYRVRVRIPGTDSVGHGYVFARDPEPIRVTPSFRDSTSYYCDEMPIGNLHIIQGGTPPWTVSLDGGEFISIREANQDIGVDRAGVIPYVIRDFDGCTVEGTLEIEDRSARPEIVSTEGVRCDGDSPGSVSYDLSGYTGHPDGQFKLVDRAADRVLSGYGVPGGYAGLPAGDYAILYEYKGCRQATDFSIVEQPGLFSAFPDLTVCAGDSVSLTPAFPTAAVSYRDLDSMLLDTGRLAVLPAGITVQVGGLDSLGCSFTDTFTIRGEEISAAFDLPPQVVSGSVVNLVDKSTPVPDSTVWTITGPAGAQTLATAYPDSSLFRFDSLGSYDVQLTTRLNGCTDTVSRTVRVVRDSSSTSTHPTDAWLRSFATFPNPVTEAVWVEVSLYTPETVQFSLLTVGGQLLRRVVRPPSVHHRWNWDVSDLPAGVYLVELVGRSGRSLSKIVRK